MRKILALPFLQLFCFAANVQAQTGKTVADTIDVQIARLPDSTAAGVPTGEKLSKEIGPAGGTIVSGDGKLELIFPADALKNATTISIQSVEPVIPHGNRSYQFEPSGIEFAQPVQIVFHYTDEEADICPPNLKFMGLQSHTGKWEYKSYSEWDSTARLLKGFIHHFSAFVDGNEVELNDTEITLKVGKTHFFSLNVVEEPQLLSGPDETDALDPLPRTVEKRGRAAIWKVNERVGGSAKHGTVATVSGELIKATYQAPAGLPADAVTVKLELNSVFVEQIIERGGRRKRIRTVTRTNNIASFSCIVKLFAEYSVVVSQDMKLEGASMSDSSAFNLRISREERVIISQIRNQLANVTIQQRKCKAIYANAATCVGMVNVSGIRTSALRPPAGGDFAWADIFFKPAQFVFPIIHFPPCGINRASNTTPPVILPNAFPMNLSFQLKNDRQYISLGKGAGEVVARPKPDDITAIIEPIRD